MSLSPEHTRELRRLLTALFDGDFSDEDTKSLEQLLASDEIARGFYRRYLELHAMLQFEDRPVAAESGAGVSPQSADEFLEYVRHTSGQDTWKDECVAQVTSRSGLPVLPEIEPDYPGRFATQPSPSVELHGSGGALSDGISFLLRPWIVMALIFIAGSVGAGLGMLIGGGREAGQSQNPMNVASFESQFQAPATPAPFAATLVKVTTCRWDPSRSTADVVGGTLRPGQSLNLLEGVAEISTSLSSGGNGRFLLEGPLSMILTSQGMPNIQYGKMTAEVNCGFDRYVLDTPMGRVVVPYAASIGMIANADELELHVFDGEALFEPPWRTENDDAIESNNATEQHIVAAGTSIRIQAAEEAEFHRGTANRALFASQVPMAADELDISKEYVETIRKANPVCYWRFEGDEEDIVRNVMSDYLNFRIIGNGLRWRSYPGNRAIEFGSTREVGYLLTYDTIDGLFKDDYTVEMWVKPSHFHHGALMSLMLDPLRSSQAVGCGLLVELRGPAYAFQSLYPGRLRFLHRNSPRSHSSGTSVYSGQPYEPRKWQHIVARKQGDSMELYLNGQLAGVKDDPTNLADRMRILVGQLYPIYQPGGAVTRPFMGELDEMAVYNRALSVDELKEHYQLVYPLTTSPKDTEDAASPRNSKLKIRPEAEGLNYSS